MANPYQRGADLKHCPDECEHIRIEYPHGYLEELRCTALSVDTCPREQAAIPVMKCLVDEGYRCVGFKGGYCSEWKERTNG